MKRGAGLDPLVTALAGERSIRIEIRCNGREIYPMRIYGSRRLA